MAFINSDVYIAQCDELIFTYKYVYIDTKNIKSYIVSCTLIFTFFQHEICELNYL